jgi:hypothetical protein
MQLILFSPEVLVLLDLLQLPEVRSQALYTAIAFHKHRIILQSNQLWDVDACHSSVLHNTSNLRQSVQSGHFEALLDEAEVPVGGKLGVVCDQEVKVQTVVELVHDTIPEHKLGHCSYRNSCPHVFPQLRSYMYIVDDCAAAFACLGQLSF